MRNPGNQIRLRGHHLLCLHGFSGQGYDDAFVRNMAGVAKQLGDHPETVVEIVEGPDIICKSCPNLEGERCTIDDEIDSKHLLNGVDQSVEMDRRVVTKVGIQVGELKEWREILYIVGQSVSADDLNHLCGDCQWKAFPYCENGLERLRNIVVGNPFPGPLD
jgi:uncharacterized protein